MKNKWSSLMLCLASLLVMVPSLHSQAVYTANRTTRIQAGAGLAYIMPDYVDASIKGVSFWADYDFLKYVGVEASVHLGTIITPADIAETSYFVGPRLVYRHRKLTGYAKILLGRATITNQFYGVSSSYNAYALGGGLEYKIARKINLRAIDFEFQQWPDFEPHTLSPIAITIGASYIIH
jgi:hypothetical protein